MAPTISSISKSKTSQLINNKDPNQTNQINHKDQLNKTKSEKPKSEKTFKTEKSNISKSKKSLSHKPQSQLNYNDNNNLFSQNNFLLSERKKENSSDLKLTKTPKNQYVGDYLNLIRCTYPYCNCGKCIQKKNREYRTSPDYNYQRNIQSMYQNEFDWKESKNHETVKKGKITHLDQGFREHIKNGLESVMHKDYKEYNKSQGKNVSNMLMLNEKLNPYLNTDLDPRKNEEKKNRNKNDNNNKKLSDKRSTKSNFNKTSKLNNINNNKFNDLNNNNKYIFEGDFPEEKNLGNKHLKNKDNNIKINCPFFGRSSYETQYPHWNTFIDKKNIEGKVIFDEVPFSGKSSYMETYGNIENKYYKDREKPIIKKDNLDSGCGKMICSTSTGQTHKKLDYKMAKYLNSMTTKASNLPNIRTAPYSNECFMTSYERAFMGNNFK